MIIWGSKGKSKTIGTGTFYCPYCRGMRNFKHERLGKYFTLYFIPLFETSKIAEYIECQTCFMTFKPEVLKHSEKFDQEREFAQQAKEFISSISRDLQAGVPVNVISKGLVNAGMSEENAGRILYTATKGQLKECKNCGFLYAAAISYCSTCGSELQKYRT
ncbi:MAG: zinc-ribbon domain-containing protein [Anaerolineales bacterium]|nr:zinc-ribbon domain-containing protein [Anaerolineales bacterium]